MRAEPFPVRKPDVRRHGNAAPFHAMHESLGGKERHLRVVRKVRHVRVRHLGRLRKRPDALLPKLREDLSFVPELYGVSQRVARRPGEQASFKAVSQSRAIHVMPLSACLHCTFAWRDGVNWQGT